MADYTEVCPTCFSKATDCADYNGHRDVHLHVCPGRGHKCNDYITWSASFEWPKRRVVVQDYGIFVVVKKDGSVARVVRSAKTTVYTYNYVSKRLYKNVRGGCKKNGLKRGWRIRDFTYSAASCGSKVLRMLGLDHVQIAGKQDLGKMRILRVAGHFKIKEIGSARNAAHAAKRIGISKVLYKCIIRRQLPDKLMNKLMKPNYRYDPSIIAWLRDRHAENPLPSLFVLHFPRIGALGDNATLKDQFRFIKAMHALVKRSCALDRCLYSSADDISVNYPDMYNVGRFKHDYADCYFMADKLGIPVQLSRLNFRDLEIYHKELTDAVNAEKDRRDKLLFEYDAFIKKLETDGFKLAASPYSLRHRAKEESHNCIYSYASEIRNGTYFILHKNEIDVGISLLVNDKDDPTQFVLALEQAYGPYNRQLTAEETDVLNAWLAKHRIGSRAAGPANDWADGYLPLPNIRVDIDIIRDGYLPYREVQA